MLHSCCHVFACVLLSCRIGGEENNLFHLPLKFKVSQPIILSRSAAEAKNLAMDRRFGCCGVRFFALLRSATKKQMYHLSILGHFLT